MLNKKVLVADDSKTMRSIITMVLKEKGLEFIEAQDGVQALELAQENRINLLITDINMPNMDGITLTQKVKEIPKYRFLKVIMVTTEFEASLKEQAKKAGASGWITKPVARETLISAITA